VDIPRDRARPWAAVCTSERAGLDEASEWLNMCTNRSGCSREYVTGLMNGRSSESSGHESEAV
jgi:hypothetical protein